MLADWIENGRPARATLLTPHPTLRYSGMVPGWIAGEHARDDGLVDLAGLAKRAGVELVLDRCVRLDPNNRSVFTESGGQIAFDIASIDTGGVGRAKEVLGEDERLLDVRPIGAFVERLDRRRSPGRIAVTGGGAGGVEMAFGLRNSARFTARPEVTLVTGSDGLLPGFGAGVARRVRDECAAQKITLVEADAMICDGHLKAGQRPLEPVDLIVAALGSAAPVWPRNSSLECDENGFIAVDRFQRSCSHPYIFAAGDVAARTDREVPHSGVHAVHTGPVLAANLRAVMAGHEPNESYRPRRRSLYLLSTGDGRAIASYGPLSAQGRWVGRWKRWIDKRWISKYARLANGT